MTNFENYDYEERYENLQDEDYSEEEIEDMLLSEEEAEPISSGRVKPIIKRELVLKCKPTYNFQSIEFEYTVDLDDENSIPTLFDVYKELVTGLKRIAPEQPNLVKVSKEVDSDVEPATEKQLEILKKFKIKHKANVSKEEANKLIQKSMSK